MPLPSQSAYINLHCHQLTTPQNLEILSIDLSDWRPRNADTGFYTLGIHPWFIDKARPLSAWEQSLNDANMIGIGECGLDKTIATPLPIQIDIFHTQIQLAEQHHKPLIIHCVRAFNELIQIKKRHQTMTAWIIHGFAGNSVLAGQLLAQGFYLSIGKTLLNPHSHIRKTLAQIPLDKLFLETDAAAEVSINQIYDTAAKILGLDVTILQQQIFANFKRVFLHD